MSGPERGPRGPDPHEQDPTDRRVHQPPSDRNPVDPDFTRFAGHTALDGSGVRDPAQARQERAARVAPKVGRMALDRTAKQPHRPAEPEK